MMDRFMYRVFGGQNDRRLLITDNIIKSSCTSFIDLLYFQLHQPRRFYQIIQNILTERHIDASDFQGSSAEEIQIDEK